MFPEFNILGRTFYTYSIFIVIGGGAAFLLAYTLKNYRNVKARNLYIMILWLVLGMFLGGTMLYNLVYIKGAIKVMTNTEIYGGVLASVRLLLGGSIFYGGLTGAIISAFIYLKVAKKPTGEYFDIVAAAVPLFHSFGRVGCFFAGCCYGVESGWGFTYTFSPVITANGVKRFPVQLLESALCLVILAVVLVLFKKKYLRGKVIWIYLICYSVVRFFTEFLRGDEYRGIYGAFSLSQWISIGYFTVSAIYLTTTFIRKTKLK